MKRNSKLSLALHALGHLGLEPDRRFTSEELAVQNATNAVVVRRVLGLLRQAGLITSETGRTGGWTLSRSADTITVADVYCALGSTLLPRDGDGPDNPADCQIEAALHGVVDLALQDAEKALIARLEQVTIGDLSRGLRVCSGGRMS
ncbi:Rrf2 family transcriptional regulator [Pontivivens ytuae]|uniref:Rrf2 family transcriptional regulator n=1 Tax=Pontivivens ytuae TaxID=2789856 RepID=A0A7S9LS56_9RHOB|nr:Rrf2 family transcriptional regulator [Pontivivens ytuae]QPH53965.1 Rrf2 family transcriptional regulator [Pontivivens ytuae]